MKKLLALIMAVVMLLSLAACKSGDKEEKELTKGEKELTKEEKFLEKLEDLFDDIYKAEKKGDQEEMDKLYEELDVMEEEYEALLEELKEEDEAKAEKFEENVEKVAEEFYNKLEELNPQPGGIVDPNYTEMPEYTALPDDEFEEIIVVDNDQCIVKITDVEYEEYIGYSVKVYLENKSSDKILQYSLESVSVNGVMSSAYLYTEVNAGKKAKETISFWNQMDIGDYTDIELTFSVTEAEDWEAEPVAYETVHVYPYGEDKATTYVREAQDSDVVLLDNSYVTIIATDFAWDDYMGYSISVYVQNKTDKKIGLSGYDCCINDFMAEVYLGATLEAGKMAFTSMNWYAENLADSDITSQKDIQTIEFELNVYDCESYNDLCVDTITLTF